jgi:hypothetical protein
MRPTWADRLDWTVINSMASKYRLSPELVAAVVQTESRGNTAAFRVEGRKMMDNTGNVIISLTWRYFMTPESFASILHDCTPATEWLGQAVGWGPMQVQGAVAREHGFRGWFPELCSWDVGVEYGCKHLRKKADAYGDDPSVLYAAYNAGSPRKTPGGLFVNQKNVDNFTQNYRGLVP